MTREEGRAEKYASEVEWFFKYDETTLNLREKGLIQLRDF